MTTLQLYGLVAPIALYGLCWAYSKWLLRS